MFTDIKISSTASKKNVVSVDSLDEYTSSNAHKRNVTNVMKWTTQIEINLVEFTTRIELTVDVSNPVEAPPETDYFQHFPSSQLASISPNYSGVKCDQSIG